MTNGEYRHQRRIACAILRDGPLYPKEARRLAASLGIAKAGVKVHRLPSAEQYGRKWVLTEEGEWWAARYAGVRRALQQRGFVVADAFPRFEAFDFVAIHPRGKVTLVRLMTEDESTDGVWANLTEFDCPKGWEKRVHFYYQGKCTKYTLRHGRWGTAR